MSDGMRKGTLTTVSAGSDVGISALGLEQRIAELETDKLELRQISTGLYAAVEKLEAENATLLSQRDSAWVQLRELGAENKRLREVLHSIIDDAAPDEAGGQHRVDTDLIYDAAAVLGMSDEDSN